ncbi:hypothetical protein AAE478_009742 [Parahypoxylon ruwenzoriense]
MCRYVPITKYNCGHEEISQYSEPGSFCLFEEKRGICSRELGRFRILDLFQNGLCRRCLPAERNISKRLGNHQVEARYMSPEEEKAQRIARSKLERSSYTPRQAPEQRRLRQLNDMARHNLLAYLQRGESYAAPVFAWVVRYIASLPMWLDRPALVAEIAPWFAEFFDEEQQAGLRPVLKFIGCEDTMESVMVWTRE